jgi:hypothetical protein
VVTLTSHYWGNENTHDLDGARGGTSATFKGVLILDMRFQRVRTGERLATDRAVQIVLETTGIKVSWVDQDNSCECLSTNSLQFENMPSMIDSDLMIIISLNDYNIIDMSN